MATSLQTGGDVPLLLPLLPPPLEAGGEANLVCFCRGCQYLEIILGCKPNNVNGDCEVSSTSKLWGWAPGQANINNTKTKRQ